MFPFVLLVLVVMPNARCDDWVLQVICYSIMTLTVTTLGTIPLATHNVRK